MLFLVSLLGLVLAGCLEIDESINIKEDGSAEARYTITVDPQYASMVVPELKKNGMPKGVTLVEEKVVNGKPTLIFSENAANLTSLRGSDDSECGARCSARAAFCGKCGTKLE